MNVNLSLCHWILDFLLMRPQVVKFNNKTSGTLVLNTGAPQGCVLSPLLYSLFTNDCVTHNDSVKMAKFADDTTISGLISKGDESQYRQDINSLANWCEENNLLLNAQKTKEMVIDFRRIKSPIAPITINGEDIEIVTDFKFLGTIISNDLSWDTNITAITKKAQQRTLCSFSENLN